MREIQYTLHSARVIHVEVDPEQRLAEVVEGIAVEFLVFFVRYLARRLQPERLSVIDLALCRFLAEYRLVLRERFALLFGFPLLLVPLVVGIGVTLLTICLRLSIANDIVKIDRIGHEVAVLVQNLAQLHRVELFLCFLV